MSPSVPAIEILRQPALAVEAPLQLSGAWFNQLCLWLQCRIGSLGARSIWAVRSVSTGDVAAVTRITPGP
jgi:hypothetical protein